MDQLPAPSEPHNRSAFNIKGPRMRTPQSEHQMNIFYIIGVVVVVALIAGFLGLRG